MWPAFAVSIALSVVAALAEHEPNWLLNGLVGLVAAHGEAPLEVEEARSSAFMAICEIGKALHRGQPAGALWEPAIGATQRWQSLVR